jgi:hypothetical protein
VGTGKEGGRMRDEGRQIFFKGKEIALKILKKGSRSEVWINLNDLISLLKY